MGFKADGVLARDNTVEGHEIEIQDTKLALAEIQECTPSSDHLYSALTDRRTLS